MFTVLFFKGVEKTNKLFMREIDEIADKQYQRSEQSETLNHREGTVYLLGNNRLQLTHRAPDLKGAVTNVDLTSDVTKQ